MEIRFFIHPDSALFIRALFFSGAGKDKQNNEAIPGQALI